MWAIKHKATDEQIKHTHKQKKIINRQQYGGYQREVEQGAGEGDKGGQIHGEGIPGSGW